MTQHEKTRNAVLSSAQRRAAWLALTFAAGACGGDTNPGTAIEAEATGGSAAATSSSPQAAGTAAQAGTSAKPAAQSGAGGEQATDAGMPSAAAGSGGAMATMGTMGTMGTTPPNTADAAVAAAAGASSAGASGQVAAADAGAVSTGPWQWPEGKPEDFGVESAWLDEAADAIQRSTGNRYGMVVVRKGTLIYEKYWDGGPDDKHIIYSCTKSWGSSLIGIAVTQGLLSVTDEVRKWVPMPAQGVSEGATLEHVITQSAHTTPPGQAFQYNSGYLLNTAPEILQAAAGMTSHAFFDRFLAQPLGLSMTWPECPAGGCAGTRYPEGFIQFGNQPPEAPNEELPLSSVRDQAKLGWLWANNGKWDDQQLIDPAYIAAGSKPGAGFRNMYGYLMWLENDEQFGAIGGVGNCYVNIMPSKQLVIAVMGNDSGLGTGGGWSSFRSLADRITD
jgi:CubicO group peptidase (beta-lactamase class C family)